MSQMQDAFGYYVFFAPAKSKPADEKSKNEGSISTQNAPESPINEKPMG